MTRDETVIDVDKWQDRASRRARTVANLQHGSADRLRFLNMGVPQLSGQKRGTCHKAKGATPLRTHLRATAGVGHLHCVTG